MTNTLPTPTSVSRLIDYQTGSVVSRELLSTSGGTITLFAFDQDQGLSEHTAPFDAFVFVLEGKVQITIAGQPHQLQSNDVFTLPANKPHALKALAPFKMLLVMIKST